MRTFQRAFLRADIPIKHTEGFNPHPFISIALPLSLGFSSECEILEFGLLEGTSYEEVPERLTAAMPEGIICPPVLSGGAEAEGALLCQLYHDLRLRPGPPPGG